MTIPPHSGKELALEFVSNLFLGAHGIPFDAAFLAESGDDFKVRGNLRIFVESAFDTERPEIDLGVVNANNHVAKSISLTSSEIPEIALRRVLDAPTFLSVHIAVDGKSILIAPTKNVPWGISQGYVRLQTNSDVQPEVWVHYQLDMHGEVVPSQNPVNFSPENVGTEQEETVRLDRTNGRPLNVRSISTAGTSLKTRVDNCVPAKDDCKLLRITLPADAPSGQIVGSVTLSFEGLVNQLPINIGGFRLAEGQKLKSLTENTSERTSVAMTKADAIDVGKVIERVQRERAVLPPPVGSGPLLKWTVGHEATIYGYLVYRSESETGPYKRVNKELIAAARDDGEGASYQWRDNSAQAGQTYWYYVGLIENDGHKRKLSDPQRVVAK
jgi:hypothetical protein